MDETRPTEDPLTKAADAGIHPSTPAPTAWPLRDTLPDTQLDTVLDTKPGSQSMGVPTQMPSAFADVPGAQPPRLTQDSPSTPAMPIVGSVTPGVPNPTTKEKRTVSVKVRMTKATRKRLRAQAKASGLTVKEHAARMIEQGVDQGDGSSAS